MYGKKICLDYRGVRRECTNCYGPHAKKFCRSERVGMENFVTGFSAKYSFVPSELYGRLSIHAMKQMTSLECKSKVPTPLETGPKQLSDAQPMKASTRPKILISLKRNDGVNWAPAHCSTDDPKSNEQTDVETPKAAMTAQDDTTVAPTLTAANHAASSVAENVSSFLSGIRATFRQDNVHVTSSRPGGKVTKTTSHDGKQI